MMQAAPAQVKIPTKSPQPGSSGSRRPAGRAKKASGPGRSKVLASGAGRESTRGGGEVIELECGITVYPARSEGGRWRAVWYEAGQRQQCEAATEQKLAPKLGGLPETIPAHAAWCAREAASRAAFRRAKIAREEVDPLLRRHPSTIAASCSVLPGEPLTCTD